MTLTRSASLSKRKMCSSLLLASSAICSANHRIKARSPSSCSLAASNNSATWSTLVNRRSPPTVCNNFSGNARSKIKRRIAASTPCRCQTLCHSFNCSRRDSQTRSSVTRSINSTKCSMTVLVAKSARPSSGSMGSANACNHRRISCASSL